MTDRSRAEIADCEAFSPEKRLREENMTLIINFILYSKTHL